MDRRVGGPASSAGRTCGKSLLVWWAVTSQPKHASNGRLTCSVLHPGRWAQHLTTTPTLPPLTRPRLHGAAARASWLGEATPRLPPLSTGGRATEGKRLRRDGGS